ncbi:uncharacterized protein F5891DRAFT_1207533 [Suillus fuscotomentosus]|uniref:Uncharacterized protein n=1 Tax=Suillus fuscotomentosus TaxID=1912939 RepID=A0AAD4DT21_9AGAM|nr:uncharacterized protein F5891DRAFT_1207533 [Suillus fuscotomentosus]KAG1893425.1 hypothetical protein F5891DRAFT_1207533 [Suillus fuscotomentosus]
MVVILIVGNIKSYCLVWDQIRWRSIGLSYRSFITLQHGWWKLLHAAASASDSAAPQLTQSLLPPINIPIYLDSHGRNASNVIAVAIAAVVHVPPPFFQHRDSLVPANMQFIEEISSLFAGNLEPGVDIPPLPPLPTNYGALAHHSSNPTYILYNMEAPVSVCPPDTSHPVSQMRDDIANVEPTQIKPPEIISDSSLYPPYLSAFLPEFGQLPALSKGGDALLPPGCDDEPPLTPDEDTAAPQEDLRGAKHMPELPHLRYNEKIKLYTNIVNCAKKNIMRHALNVRSLSDEEDRTVIVETTLKEAAIRYMNAKGSQWASYNSGQFCHKNACNLVKDGFDLRLSIWSQASEREHMENAITHLLDDQVFPPNFIMGLGTDNLWHFLENKVVLNVMLDTVRELNLSWQLTDVNSLACTAAVAVCYALERVRPSGGDIPDNEFSGATFKDLYTRLMNYITEVVLCELACKNPQDYYLPLALQLFHLLTTSSNNWMLIKIIKLFGSLSPHEPWLVKKLQPQSPHACARSAFSTPLQVNRDNLQSIVQQVLSHLVKPESSAIPTSSRQWTGSFLEDLKTAVDIMIKQMEQFASSTQIPCFKVEGGSIDSKTHWSRANTQDLMLGYSLPAFSKGNPTSFLAGMAHASGLIKKGLEYRKVLEIYHATTGRVICWCCHHATTVTNSRAILTAPN